MFDELYLRKLKLYQEILTYLVNLFARKAEEVLESAIKDKAKYFHERAEALGMVLITQKIFEDIMSFDVIATTQHRLKFLLHAHRDLTRRDEKTGHYIFADIAQALHKALGMHAYTIVWPNGDALGSIMFLATDIDAYKASLYYPPRFLYCVTPLEGSDLSVGGFAIRQAPSSSE